MECYSVLECLSLPFAHMNRKFRVCFCCPQGFFVTHWPRTDELILGILSEPASDLTLALDHGNSSLWIHNHLA